MADTAPGERRHRAPSAKLVAPSVPPHLVPRPRLTSTLDAARDGTVVLLSAAVGSGKTALLADWVGGHGRADTAWVSLDATDNDDERFWSALLDVLARCEAIPREHPLRGVAVPAAPSSDPGFLAEVVDALGTLPRTVWLILDNLHELTHPRPLHGLATLMRHLPAGLRLVLSTRHDPPLPLGRLRIAGRLTELTGDDLRFSSDEAHALFRAAGLDLDVVRVGRLLAQTEGWGAGLRLAALALSETTEPDPVVEDRATHHRAVAEYLAKEVLSRLPAGRGELLTALSVCERVPVELAVRLSGRADAGALLDALTRQTSLVTRTESGPAGYRTHALLRSHLHADLTRRDPAMAARLHGTAAAWFASQDQAAPALSHAGRAGDATLAGALARKYVAPLLLSGDHQLIRHMLDVLGARPVAEDSLLALISAFLHLELGDTATADRDLRNACAVWPPDPAADLLALDRLVRSRRAQVEGDVDQLLHSTEPGDNNEGADQRADTPFTALTQVQRGIALLLDGRVPAAREYLEAALQNTHHGDHAYLVAQCMTAFGALAAAEGNYSLMVELARGVHDRHTRSGWTYTLESAIANCLLGYGALLQADPSECLRHAELAGALADVGDPPVNQGLRLLVETLRGAAEFELGQWADGARRVLVARQDIGDVRCPASQVAMTAMIGHRTAALLGWHQTAGDYLRWAESVLPRAGEVHVMRARTHLLTGRYDAAGKAVRPVLDGTARPLMPWAAIDAWLLECEVAIGAGADERASHALRNALDAAQRMKVFHPVVFARRDVVELMRNTLDQLGVLDRFAHRMLTMRDELGPPPMPPTSALTPRSAPP